jgi:hypothetical protein
VSCARSGEQAAGRELRSGRRDDVGAFLSNIDPLPPDLFQSCRACLPDTPPKTGPEQMMLQKRRRSASVSSASSAASTASGRSDGGRSTSSSSSSSSLSTPAHKQSRLPVAEQSGRSWTCSLEPTCSAKPQHFATARELEAHYARVHELACEAIVNSGGSGGSRPDDVKGKGRMQDGRCGCVFPERRLLELVRPDPRQLAHAASLFSVRRTLALTLPPPPHPLARAEQHQNEFHNPLLAELAARGERIVSRLGC